VIPGYGGGMSSAKAQLESDTRVLAWEAGRKYKVRVNTISAGPLKSRAASAIGKEVGKKTFIECVVLSLSLSLSRRTLRDLSRRLLCRSRSYSHCSHKT
jgi:enoyl-[acyl-carrier-protein] reductase (NADH)